MAEPSNPDVFAWFLSVTERVLALAEVRPDVGSRCRMRCRQNAAQGRTAGYVPATDRLDPVRAPEVTAIDEDAANDGFAHLAEADFLGLSLWLMRRHSGRCYILARIAA